MTNTEIICWSITSPFILFGIGLVALKLSAGPPLTPEALAALRLKGQQALDSAPIKYPHILKTFLLLPGGAKKRATVEVREDGLIVRRGAGGPVVARLAMTEITSLMYKSENLGGNPSEGLGVNTVGGQLQFFNDGFFTGIKKTVHVIERTYKTATGYGLRVDDLTVATKMTPESIYHRVKD